MQHWTNAAIEVLRQTSSIAFHTGNLALQDLTLNAIDALKSDTGWVPADLLIYEMVLCELYRNTGNSCVQDSNISNVQSKV